MEIVKHNQLPLSEIATISETFAKSGLFSDAKDAAQAMVKIYAGQEIGLPPFASMSGIHVIQGKPVMGAGLIASRVKGSGKYDYAVVEHTDKVCNIDFMQAWGNEWKKIGNSTFTIEDAKKAGTKNIDKFPKNMLFARAISNGVKWYCPDVFAGPIYVPEEMNTITEDGQGETTTTPGEKVKATVTKWQPTIAELDEINALIESSTLDDNGRATATNSVANATTAKKLADIKARLLTLQPTT